MKIYSLIFLLGFLFPVVAHAQWLLDNDASELHFVSTKSELIAESHRFKSMEGAIDKKGDVSVTIDLSSVDTLIPIRDERIKEHVFKVNTFPRAEISAKVESSLLKGMKLGKAQTLDLPVTVSMLGLEKSYDARVSVLKLKGGKIQVQSIKPIIVSASDFKLEAGIEMLRNLAGLPSIEPIVPVTFLLTFDGKK